RLVPYCDLPWLPSWRAQEEREPALGLLHMLNSKAIAGRYLAKGQTRESGLTDPPYLESPPPAPHPQYPAQARCPSPLTEVARTGSGSPPESPAWGRNDLAPCPPIPVGRSVRPAWPGWISLERGCCSGYIASLHGSRVRPKSLNNTWLSSRSWSSRSNFRPRSLVQ